MVLSQPPLCEESQDEIHADGGVDTDKEPVHVPQNDRCVEIFEHRSWPEAIEDPKWKWSDEA